MCVRLAAKVSANNSVCIHSITAGMRSHFVNLKHIIFLVMAFYAPFEPDFRAKFSESAECVRAVLDQEATMLRIRNTLFGLAALAVTACGQMESVTRNAPFESTMPKAPVIQQAAVSFEEAPEIVSRAIPELTVNRTQVSVDSFSGYNVVDVIVDVPRTLTVSEANTLIPNADIVWQEQAAGDRYAQVQSIVEGAMEVGTMPFNGDLDVLLYVEVKRFHALTRAARVTVGGGHNLLFELTLLDPETGDVIVPAWSFDASFAAYGGAAALVAERAGLTQEVRISQHLIESIYEELGGDLSNRQVASR